MSGGSGDGRLATATNLPSCGLKVSHKWSFTREIRGLPRHRVEAQFIAIFAMKKAIVFNDPQLYCLSLIDVHTCTLAVPGCGKTAVIVHKSCRQVRAGRRVVACTFTKSAANELAERVQEELGNAFPESFRSGTFHSLFLRALRDQPDSPTAHRRIADEAEVRNYMVMALQDANLKPWSKNLRDLEAGRAKVKDPFEIQDAERRAQGDGSGGAQLERALALDKALRAYEGYLVKARLIDMSGVLVEALRYLNAGGSLFEDVNDLLVDEAQDMDEIQLELVSIFARRSVRVDLVGDDDQSIYGFRQGLGKKGLDRFIHRFKAEGVLMSLNYRCKREILDWAGAVIAQNQHRVVKHLEAARGPGGRVRLVSFSNMDMELDFVARRVQQLVAAGKATSEEPVAVIARQNWILDEFEDVVGDSVPFDRPKGDSLWDRSDVGAVVSFLRCVADPERESAGFDHLLSAWGATAQDIEEFRKAAPEHAISKLVPCWSADQLPVPEVASRAMFWLNVVCDVAGYPSRPHGGIDASRVLADVESVILDGFESAGKYLGLKTEVVEATFNRIKAAFRVLARMQGSLGQRIAAVMMNRVEVRHPPLRLLTMHGAKGLEFRNVFVIGCDDATIPGRPYDQDEEDEERRLLYVAMTRAKDNLTVSYASAYRRRAEVVAGTLCRFLSMTLSPSMERDPLQ